MKMYGLVCIDETWGYRTIVEELPPSEKFADAKARVVLSVDLHSRVLRRRGHPFKVWTVRESGSTYVVAVEWRPEGPDGIICSFVYEASPTA